MLGVPYIYGGNNRLQGLDCSGFVCEVIRSFGLLRPGEDLSCQLLYDRYWKKIVQEPGPAHLLFFGKNKSKISHVALALNQFRMIEAGGGDETCKDFHRAAILGAMVRERPIGFRNDLVAIVNPWE